MQFRFFLSSPHGDRLRDINYCETHALGGSETAVLRLSRELMALGHAVDLATDPTRIPVGGCDVFVSLRHPDPFGHGARFGDLHYLWCQDDVDQPLLASLWEPPKREAIFRELDALFLISQYQVRRWVEAFAVPAPKVFAGSNGITYPAFEPANMDLRRGPVAYYASTPFRGLDLLLEAWPVIHAAVPEARLKVFSSMQVYGVGADADRYQALYDQARALPGVDYIGSVPQAQLRAEALRARVMAYPCTFPETGCIAAMEAMAAGCAVVSTDLGALPETAWRNPLVCARGSDWLTQWAFEVARVLVDDDHYQDIARRNLALAPQFDWSIVARRFLLRIRSDRAARGLPQA